MRSATCWDRSASAPKNLAAGSAHAAATTRGRAVGGFGASRRSSPRRCGTNGAGSSASSRCSAGGGQAGAAAAIAPGRPIRHLGVVQRRLAAVARYGRFGLCPPRFVPVVCLMARAAFSSFRANSAVWPLNDNRGRFYEYLVAHRSVRRSGHRLRDLGHALGALGRCRQRENAGDRRRHPRGRAGLSEAAIFDHRRGRRRHLPDCRLFPRLAGRRRLCGRRHPVRLGRLHRHERLGARQCAHRASRDQVARRRARNRVPRRRHHRHAGGRPGAARRDALFRLPHRHAAHGAERSRSDRCHGGARLRRLADLDLRPPWRRHFHQGRRRWRRSGRQGRSRHSGRRSTQPGDHRRQRGRQCRRLRRHGGRLVRDLCGDHGRHHGAGRDLLRRLAATCCSR